MKPRSMRLRMPFLASVSSGAGSVTFTMTSISCIYFATVQEMFMPVQSNDQKEPKLISNLNILPYVKQIIISMITTTLAMTPLTSLPVPPQHYHHSYHSHHLHQNHHNNHHQTH